MERYISRFLSGKGLSPDLFEEERFFSVAKGDTFYDELDFYKSLYEALRLKWGRSALVGDKIPKLYLKYEQVFERFPEARVIFISRNLIDVATSYKRRAEDQADHAWSGDRDAMRAIDDWNAANSQTLAAIERFPKQLYVLSYESFFIEEKGLNELFSFAGLEPTLDVRKHFEFQMQRSGAIRAQRTENLSATEKLAICTRADLPSFRHLLEKCSVLPSGAQRAPAKSSKASPPKMANASARARANADGARKVGKYQDPDSAICDYKYAQLLGTETLIRGPIPEDLSGGFIAYLGAAQTFGRFVEHPYPSLLQQQLGVPALNLGHGGGKPEFYLRSKGLLEIINRAKCAVIQVMSARGSPNRFLKPTSYLHNVMTIADGIPARKNPVFVDGAYRTLLKEIAPEKLREAIVETRANWLVEMRKLLDRISVPKLLFWFSVRDPAYVEKFGDLDALLGAYPHLVTEAMITALRRSTQGYVECVSNLGMPYDLLDAKTHKPVDVFPWQSTPSVNYYYPSAEMHAAAAESLAPALARMMK
jgi:hypothetical protein